MNKKQTYTFNLSLLSSSEAVLRCELYISKRHIKQRMLFDLHYALYTRTSSGASSGNNRTLTAVSGGHELSTQIDLGNLRLDRHSLMRTNNWHSFNLIDSLRPYVEARRAQNTVTDLLLVMETRRGLGRGARSGTGRLVSPIDLSNPYLMIFTKEHDASMKQFFQVFCSQ